MIRCFKILAIYFLAPVFTVAQNPVKAMPDFLFFRLDKTPFTETSIAHGRKTFFVFFDADCDHCQHAAQNLQHHYISLKNTNIYLISLDDKRKIQNFLNTNCPELLGKPNVTILQDLNNEFIGRFNPRKYPSMLLYSSARKLLLYRDDEK